MEDRARHEAVVDARILIKRGRTRRKAEDFLRDKGIEPSLYRAELNAAVRARNSEDPSDAGRAIVKGALVGAVSLLAVFITIAQVEDVRDSAGMIGFFVLTALLGFGKAGSGIGSLYQAKKNLASEIS